MELLLERTGTIPLQEKVEIQKELKMYDSLWESHPKVKAIKAEVAEKKAEIEAEARKMRAEGKAEGETQALRRTLVNVVRIRFPSLAEIAQQEAERINSPGALDLLIQKVIEAPDENIARWLLTPPTAL